MAYTCFRRSRIATELKHDTATAIDFLCRFHPGSYWVLATIIPDDKIETATFTPDHWQKEAE
mgnify:CR=1 FL=1